MNSRLLLAGLLGLAFASAASADPYTYRVNLVFGSAPSANGPFSLDFQLNGTFGNTVAISSFSFNAGGGFNGNATFFGLASGNPQNGFSLANSSNSFSNEIYIQLSAATTQVSFTVTQSDAPPFGGGSPDAFSVALLDGGLANIPTTGVGNALVLANLTGGANPGAGVTSASGTGAYNGVTSAVAPIPEPGPVAGILVALGAAVAWGRARRSAVAA